MPRSLALSLVLLATGLPEARSQDVPLDTLAIRVLGIVVEGNRVTQERIILRELVFEEGDTMPTADFYERLERGRQNLVNTGLFNTVVALPLFLDARSVIVEVTVNERWYLWPSVKFRLADPNFNTWWLTKDLSRVNYGLYLTKYNFRGMNETISAMVQFGYTRQFALRYKAPFIDKKQRWGLSIGGAYLEQEEVTAATVENVRVLLKNPDGPNRTQRTADMELTLRRNHDVRHSWRLRWMNATVTDTITDVAIDYFDGPALSTQYFTLGYGLVWDRRDMRAYPRSGHFAEFRIDRFGLGVFEEASPDITTLYGTGKRWWRMADRFTLALSLRGKATLGEPPYFVQEGLGYDHFVRGYEYYVVDGEHFVLGKCNFIFQLVEPVVRRVESVPLEAFRTLYFALYLDLFVDAGRVWDQRYAEVNFLEDRWLSGYGIGIDLVSSYDQVVRGEYTLNALGEHGFFLHFTQPF